MTAYGIPSPATYSPFALKSKGKRMAQLAAVRKRRARAYRVFAEKQRMQQTMIRDNLHGATTSIFR